MKQNEILEMARQAGIDHHKLWNDDGTNNLEAFAKLVAAKASAKEREACAKVCEEIEKLSEGCDDAPAYRYYEAIRARGEA